MALSKVDPNSFDVNSIGQYGGRRNLIINGAMQVAQRSTSHTYNNSESGYHTLDRYYSVAFVSSGTLAVSQQTVSLSDNIEAEYFLRATTTGSVAAGSATVYTEQKVEGLKQFHNRSVTLSFYVKADSSLTFQLRRHKYYGSGGSSEEYSGFTDVPVTTSWTRHTVTFAAEDFSSKTFGANAYYGIMFYWTTGQGSDQLNDASIDITNVQLEFGDTATPFEHRSYGEELALCQRYYSQISFPSYSTFATGQFTYNPATSQGTTLLAQTPGGQMRVTPAMTFTQSVGDFYAKDTGGGTKTLNGLTLRGYSGGGTCQLQATSASSFGNDDQNLNVSANGADFQFDAEL